jgi:hypothetical protein
MNMSTCVSLQPFGYNFNGGKLLATLAFSKEVLTYFQNKYNEPLLGITTTSLYGKSIQYDRLIHLKFVGYTKGNSVQSITPEITKLCNEYLKKECGLNYKLAKKFIILQKTFDKLNIPKEEILTLYRITIEDIERIKQFQWKIFYYTIVSQTGLFYLYVTYHPNLTYSFLVMTIILGLLGF